MSGRTSKQQPTKQVFITLGSNIDPDKNLKLAVMLLADEAGIDVTGVSRVYRTPPINARGEIDPTQDDYLNAALLIETALPIMTLKKEVLRRIEARLERIRTQDKYAPRTIDLDIVLYGDEVLGLIIEEPEGGKELIFPDPDITRLAHVALPVADLAPDFVHPVTGRTLEEIARRFDDAEGITVEPLDLAGDGLLD